MKKSGILILSFTFSAIGLTSCVRQSDKLNLDNDISLDVVLAPEGTVVPIGTLDTIFVDSLLNIDYDDPDAILKLMDSGIYGLSLDGEVSGVSVDINDISVNIASPDIEPIKTDFDDPVPDDVEMTRNEKHTSFRINTVSLDDINDALPTIKSSQCNNPVNVSGIPQILEFTCTKEMSGLPFDIPVDIDMKKQNLDILESGETPSFVYQFDYNGKPISVTVPKGLYVVPRINKLVSIPEQKVSCGFVYDSFPTEVSQLNTIYFGTPGTQKGQRLSFSVNLGQIDAIMHLPSYVIKELRVALPDGFFISKDEESPYFDCMSVSENNVLVMNDINLRDSTESVNPSNPTMIDISFILDSLILNAGPDEPGAGTMTYNGEIAYQATLAIGGVPHIIGTANLNTEMSIENKMSLKDVSFNTNPIEVSLPSGSVKSDFEVSGLDQVSVVKTISFDEEHSMISMSINDFDIAPFEISSEESGFYVIFDDMFRFDESYCCDEYGNTVGSWEYDAARGKKLLHVNAKALGKTFRIKLSGIDLNKKVEDGLIGISTEIEYEGKFLVKPKDELRVSDLSVLGDKDCDIAVWGGFDVTNAEVVTSVITTEIDRSTFIDIEEKIDDAICGISHVGFKKDAMVSMKMKFNGIPESLKQIEMDSLCITFPEFMDVEYQGNDPRLSFDSSLNSIVINGNVSENELRDDGSGFVVDGIAVTGLSFPAKDNPVVKRDGNTYIVLKNQEVLIKGDVNVNNQTVNSDELESITVMPEVSISELEISTVEGKVNPAIDPVIESISLSLGDDLDFLDDMDYSLKLSSIRLSIRLNSTIPVPLTFDISISSKDKDGNFICESLTPDDGIITVPACPSDMDVRPITILISNVPEMESVSGDTVFVLFSSLSELACQIPDSIMFSLVPGVDQSVSHRIDLTKELTVDGSYNVDIPFSFEELYVNYTDTIDGISEEIEDFTDFDPNGNVVINATIVTTIPFGVDISAKALDRDGNVIDGMAISEIAIPASKNGQEDQRPVSMSVRTNEGSLAKLDKISFTASCRTDEYSNGFALRNSDFILIKDASICIENGISVDLSDQF